MGGREGFIVSKANWKKLTPIIHLTRTRKTGSDRIDGRRWSMGYSINLSRGSHDHD